MKQFFNFLVLIIFPFVLSVSASSLSNDPVAFITKEYCNARFGFCLQYPSDVLVSEQVTVNGDGVQLSNADGNIEVWAFGTFNVFNDDIEAIVAESIADLSLSESDIDANEVNLDKGYGYFVYKTATHWHYQKIVLFNDAFIKLHIKVLSNQKELLEKIKQDIRLDVLL